MKIQGITQSLRLNGAEHIICNGYVSPIDAYRAIAVDHATGEPRVVHKSVNLNKLSNRATWQYIHQCDLIYSASRKSRNAEIVRTVSAFKNGKVFELPEDTAKEYWEKLPEEWKSWLLDMVYVESKSEAKKSHLPVGIGWDGLNTEMVRRKRHKITRFLSRVPENVRDAIIEEAVTSPFAGLQNDWDRAPELPKQMRASPDDFYMDEVNKNCTVAWIVYHEGNWSEYLEYCTQDNKWHSSREDTKLHGTKGTTVQFPSTVTKAIKLFIKPYGKPDNPKGLAWKIFARKEKPKANPRSNAPKKHGKK